MQISVKDRTTHPNQLRGLRKAAGLSQQALAERAKCSISAVALFERGYAPQRSATLDRVLAVLAAEANQRDAKAVES